ncbi:MAG: L-histidine N(alpha)-methyltransferase, partial [Bacteroidetes bacterium]|nr:L-histidine N(alpha)-methyltransferase [Bacteroidota bacterium]
MDQVFAKDVVEGLSANPKFLPSKYFYDETGDGLFQQIMQLQEYYLTHSEFEIFSQQRSDLLKLFQENSTKFNLVEFGAGDGLKTKVLLEYFVQQQADFQYVPIDISQNVLDQLILSLKKELPQLKVKSLNAEYFAGLKALDHNENSK